MWDERYSSDEFAYGTEPNDFLRENHTKIPKGKVLCLAEGEGRNAVFLAQNGYEVTAVDSSAVGIEKAKKLAFKNKVEIEFLVEDLQTFDLGIDKWDGIVSIFCHLPESLQKDVLAKVTASLKTGGVFLLEGYTPKQLEFGTGGPPVKEMMISAQLLKDELPEINFERLVELERDIQEGTCHHGIGAVVQGIGYKPI